MRKSLSILFSLAALTFAQETSTETPQKTDQPAFITDLQNLPQEKRDQYGQLFVEAQALFQQKRIFECLEMIDQLEAIYPNNPAVTNMRGACYVEFRNFPKARLAFAKSSAALPDDFNIRFNIAEIDFVAQNYPESLKRFQELYAESEKKDTLAGIRPLIQFKVVLCLLKTDQVPAASEIVEATSFLDDTPLHYFGNAALLYQLDQKAQAEQWLARASRVFGNTPEVLAPWQDTLIEFGYIKSFYGGDLEIQGTSPVGDGPSE